MTEIARMYGGSLYDLAAEEGLETRILDELDEAAKLIRDDPEYLRLLSTPSIPKKERCALLDEAFRGQVHLYVLNFLKILCENGTLRELPGCARAYRIRYNAAHGIGAAERRVNGLHQTNLGVFRAYLVRYLQNEVPVNKSMTLMVRQLQPTETGLPMQLYFFTDTVVWVDYERIQSDVFDHVLAVIPEFGLRVFQNPSGADVVSLRAPAPQGGVPPASQNTPPAPQGTSPEAKAPASASPE